MRVFIQFLRYDTISGVNFVRSSSDAGSALGRLSMIVAVVDHIGQQKERTQTNFCFLWKAVEYRI